MNLSVELCIPSCLSKSPSAILWFVFQLFIKLPTVTQKAAKSPDGLHTYTVQHHLSYLGLSWAYFSINSPTTFTLLPSHLSLHAYSWVYFSLIQPAQGPNNRCDAQLAIGPQVFNGNRVQLAD